MRVSPARERELDLKRLTDKHVKPLLSGEGEELRMRFWEELVILGHILRWSLLATIVGVLSGTGTAIFLRLLHVSIGWVETLPLTVRLVLPPLGGLLTGLLIHYLSPQSAGHGTEAVIRAVHKNNGKIPLSVPPVKMAASIISTASGFSVGKEGPAAQIGAGLASFFSWCLNLTPEERRKVVICGISGGFASVFGTPIAGALFGVEVLFLGKIMYEVLYPSLVAGLVANWTASKFGVIYPFTHWHLPDMRPPALDDFPYFVAAGVLFGLVAFLFIEMLSFFTRLFKRMRLWAPARPMIGGVLLTLFAFELSLFSDRYFDFFGLGTDTIKNAVSGTHALIVFGAAAVFLKMLFTSISLGSGGSGGIVTPIFFIGTTSGLLVANVLPLDPTLLCQLGFTAVLAACANTPISASVMALELFGPSHGWVAALTVVVAFLVVGHRSVYETQILGLRKTDALLIRSGDEVGTSPHSRLSYSMIWKLARIRHLIRKLFR